MKSTLDNRASRRSQPGDRWRKALRAIAMPAMRVHNYRNLHKAMFYEAVCEWECGKKR